MDGGRKYGGKERIGRIYIYCMQELNDESFWIRFIHAEMSGWFSSATHLLKIYENIEKQKLANTVDYCTTVYVWGICKMDSQYFIQGKIDAKQ